MRRKDREITEIEEILAILDKCEHCRLALVDGDKPYVIPLNFGYERNDQSIRIYFHGAKSGRKTDLIKANSNACFEVDCSQRLVKSPDPCEWTSEYESVIAEGSIAIIDDPEKKLHAMDQIMKHLGFEGKAMYNDAIIARTQLFQLDVANITGKRNITVST